MQQNEVVFDIREQPGATEPLGFWDPLGLCPTDKAGFRKFRVSELKHGRIAMLASVGLVAQHWIRFPGGGFDEVPNGVFALSVTQGSIGFCILVFVCLVLEFGVVAQDPTREVGDFGDPLSFGASFDDSQLPGFRNRELNNGRFAMFATLGVIVAELATGKDAIEQLGLA